MIISVSDSGEGDCDKVQTFQQINVGPTRSLKVLKSTNTGRKKRKKLLKINSNITGKFFFLEIAFVKKQNPYSLPGEQ
jgi:hypothetical protein